MLEVGVFVTVGILLAMMAIFFIGRERSLFEERYSLKTRFENVDGLRKGATVQLNGLSVGSVDAIHFPDNLSSDALDVVLKINADFKERIRKDSKAGIRTQGLLGDKYIAVTVGSPGQPILEDGAFLEPEEKETGIKALAEKGEKMMEEIRLAAVKFQASLDKVPFTEQDKYVVHDALLDLNVVLDGIREGEGTIGGLLRDPALYHDLRGLMGRANRNKLLKNLIRASIAEQERASTQPVKGE